MRLVPRTRIDTREWEVTHPVSRRELWALLHGLVHDGMGVLLATPYMDEAERCSRVVLLADARVLAQGSPQDLVARFEHVDFRIEAEARSRVDALLEADPRVLAVTPAGPQIKAVVLRAGAGDVDRALRALGARVTETKADFEDLYLSLVVTQDVVPVVCPTCNGANRFMLNVPEVCAGCGGRGTVGRIAQFDALVVDDVLRAAIAAGGDRTSLRSAL